jgi:hypothetical protein
MVEDIWESELESELKDFFAGKKQDYPLLKAKLREILQNTMKQYYDNTRYVANIDFFHLPNGGASEVLKYLKSKRCEFQFPEKQNPKI